MNEKKRLLIKLIAMRWWQLLMYICVFVLLILLIIELSFDLDENTLHIIGIIDLFVWFVFVTDLAYSYITAVDKKGFLKHDWVSPESRANAADMVADMAVANPALAVKGTQRSAHLENERFFMRFFIKPRNIKVYSSIGPNVNRQVADGILEGIDLFVKQKLRLNPVHKELKTFNEPKSKRDNCLEVFITKNAISNSSINSKDSKRLLQGTIVFATAHLSDLRNYKDSKDNLNYLKKLRGKITAYNKLAKLFNYDACNNEHCTFNFNKEELDVLAFLSHLNKNIPLCHKHNCWKY